jgi:hypothetical protein
MPSGISGQGGHQATFDVAVALIHGFDIDDAPAWQILSEFNQRCDPPWSDRELQHKLADAQKLTRHPMPRGYLRGSPSENHATSPAITPEPMGEAIRWDVKPHVPRVRKVETPAPTKADREVPKPPRWTDEQIRLEHRPLWRMDSDGRWKPLNDAARKMVQAALK